MSKSEAMRGLALKHYLGKWKQAQKMCKQFIDRPDYWTAVRESYLALGGLYIHQLLPKQQAAYFEGHHHA